jgi:cell division ATPase FtsA
MKNSVEIERNEALADIDYFIHECKENGIKQATIEKLEKGLNLIRKAKNEIEIKDHLAILSNIFQKAF